MNLVVLHGRLAKDVESRYSQSATPVAIGNFSIAVKKDFAKQGEQETDFFNCVAFGKTAENIQKYFKKGDGIIVKGRLQNDIWQQEGKNRVSTKIVVDGFDFAEKVSSSSNQTQSSISNMQDDEDLPF